MIPRILAPVALVAGSLVVSLLVGEVALRSLGHEPRRISPNPNFWVTGWAAMDEELGWRNRQGSFRSVEPGNALMNFESDGRRSDPIGPKGPHIPKILVVGCSYTQGEGVADDEPYSHVINRALPNFEVLNYGTGGYGTYQSLLRIKSYFRSSPAPTPLVLYGYDGHHIVRNVASADWVSMLTTRDGRYLVPPHVRVSGDRLIELPGHPVELWPLETRSAIVALGHQAAMQILRHATWREHVDIIHRLLRDMNATVRERKASLVVLRLTKFPQPEAEWLQREGIDYIDCEHPDPLDPDLRVGGWGHPNRKMQAWWGECILRGLAVRGYAVSRAKRNE